MTQTLLADIGGTYTRFWLLKKDDIVQAKVYFHKPFMSMKKLVETFLTETNSHPQQFIAGAAGKLIKTGRIKLTNRRLVINMPDLCKLFGFQTGLLVNDMIPHTVSVLDKPDTKNACVIVIGTGLGCGYIKNHTVIASEAGHLPITKPTAEQKRLSAIEWEDIISGPAFLRIYQYLSDKPVTRSREVSFLAHNYKDKNALMTYRIMAQSLAQFCLTIHKTENIPVFYLGGLAVELIRSEKTRNIFFDTLGKTADILSIRIIKQADESALTGLKMLATELNKNGQITCIHPTDFYLYKNK